MSFKLFFFNASQFIRNFVFSCRAALRICLVAHISRFLISFFSLSIFFLLFFLYSLNHLHYILVFLVSFPATLSPFWGRYLSFLCCSMKNPERLSRLSSEPRWWSGAVQHRLFCVQRACSVQSEKESGGNYLLQDLRDFSYDDGSLYLLTCLITWN